MSRKSYSLLIIDDEEWIRRGLSAKVAGSPLPFTEVREAGDVEAAWRIIDEILPDVILCDIRMAGADGLDLCERVARGFPETRIIIVSGYDEFGYARRALQFSAIDYLLKPVDAPALYRALERSIEELDRRRVSSESATSAERVARRSRFREIVESGVDVSEDVAREYLSDYRRGDSFFRALRLIRPWERHARAGAEPAEIIDACRDFSEGRNLIWCPNPMGGATVVLCHRSETQAESAAARLAEALCAGDDGAAASDAAVGLSSPEQSLLQSTCEAARLAKQRVLLGRGGVVRDADAAEWKSEYTLHADRTAILEAALRHRDEARITEILGDVSREMEKIRVCYSSASTVFRHLLLLAREGGAPEPSSANIFEGPELFAFPSLDEAFRYLDEEFKRAASSRSHPASVPHAAMIHAIREHIDSHFAEVLSLKELAARCHVNPSYLSEVFHSTTGVTFQDYVAKTRIDQAKLLLATRKCRMGEVAERTGFSDHNYFSKVFKRLTGLSPSEFCGRERGIQ